MMVRAPHRRSRRRLLAQALEARCVLAGWHNPNLALDIDRDDQVTLADVSFVLEELSRPRFSVDCLLDSRPDTPRLPYFDVNGDEYVTPLDGLLVINALDRNPLELGIQLAPAPGVDPNGNGWVLQSAAEIDGQTSPFAKVSLRQVAIAANQQPTDSLADPIETLADADGRFRVTIFLAPGRNRLSWEVRDQLGRRTETTRELVWGDVITDWNAAVLNMVRAWPASSNQLNAPTPPKLARDLAMIHLAMADAVGGTLRTGVPFRHAEPAPAGSSPIAAAAAAAFEVARALYPQPHGMAVWQATWDESLQRVAEDPSRQRGIDYGRQVAATILRDRSSDGSAAVVTYSPSEQPGKWRPTAPDFAPALLPHWGAVRPFAISDPESHLTADPPELEGQIYAAAVDEVLRLGRVDSTERTAEQTAIALFWADGLGTATPPGRWNRIAVDCLAQGGWSLAETARGLGLLNIALADAAIAVWDAKYAFELWRPITAIREAAEDGNPATEPVSDWLPLIQTPPFPAYTSGHSAFSGAAAAVLTELLGADFALATTADSPSGLTRPLADVPPRSFANFTAAAEEAGRSRIYGGIHFEFDNRAGLTIGSRIGLEVIAAARAAVSGT